MASPATKTTTTGSSPAQPIPVVVCGAREAIGQVVIEGLKPEYEVVLFCLGAQALATELPQLLSSPDTFAPVSSTIGSGAFSASRPPRAVCFGGVWGVEDVALVQDSLLLHQGAGGDSSSSRSIPPEVLRDLVLLRNDPRRQPPQTGEGAVVMGTPAYSAQIIRRLRTELGKLVVAAGGGDGGVGAGKGREALEGPGWRGFIGTKPC
ncbi:hypothetical protein MN608_05818 [Microdochium nivale]|nr:hypothetical protein MN608_05818 [Microdochium nivale]